MLNKLYNFLDKYFTGIVVLIIILVFYFGYIYLIDSRLQALISKTQESNVNQENILKTQRERLSQMNKNLDFFKQISIDDIKRPKKVVPDVYPKEKLLGEIEDLVLQNGFLFSNLSIQKESIDNPHLGVIKIQFTVNNIDYIGLKNFLNTLENNLPLMDILSLNFSPNSENLSLLINTYYFIP